MRDDLNYIDKLYKSKLTGISEEAGIAVWRKLFWSLLWWRYKWYLLISAVVVLMGFGLFSLYTSNNTDIDGLSNTTSMTEVKSSPLRGNNGADMTVTGNAQAYETTSQGQTAPEESVSSLLSATSQNSANRQVETYTSVVSGSNSVDDNQNKQEDDSYLAILEAKNATLNIQLPSDSIKLGDNRRTDIVPFGIKDKKYSLDIYSGYFLNGTGLSGYDKEYLDYRNNYEANGPGWSAGVVFEYHLKNWSLGTGINYSVYRTWRDYNYSYNTYDPDNSYYDYDTTWFWIYDAPDIGRPMVKEIDSTWVKVYKENKVDNSGYNHVSYLEVPLLVGYRFRMNHWSIKLNTGVSVGFLTSNYYKVPDFNNYQQIVEVTQMNRVMLNYLVSVTLYYQLDEDLSLFVAPVYKHNLQSIFKTNYPVKEQFKAFGLTLGVSYSF